MELRLFVNDIELKTKNEVLTIFRFYSLRFYFVDFCKIICSSENSIRSAIRRITSLTLVFSGRNNLNNDSWRKLSRLQTSNSWRFSLFLREKRTLEKFDFPSFCRQTERNRRPSSADRRRSFDSCRAVGWSERFRTERNRELGWAADRKSTIWRFRIDAFDCAWEQICERWTSSKVWCRFVVEWRCRSDIFLMERKATRRANERIFSLRLRNNCCCEKRKWPMYWIESDLESYRRTKRRRSSEEGKARRTSSSISLRRTFFVERDQLVNTVEKRFLFDEDRQSSPIRWIVFENIDDLNEDDHFRSMSTRRSLPSDRNHRKRPKLRSEDFENDNDDGGWREFRACERSKREYLHRDERPERQSFVDRRGKGEAEEDFTKAMDNRWAKFRKVSKCWAWTYLKQRLFCNNSTGLKKTTFSLVRKKNYFCVFLLFTNEIGQTVRRLNVKIIG